MTYLITKASSDYWYQIKEFYTLEGLMNFIKNECNNHVVIEKNYNDENIMEYWEGMKEEDAKIIPTLEYNIIIYDSWIE